MADSPYTTKRFNQFRGPDSSEDYNARIEENYKDLVYLYNKTAQTETDLKEGYSAFLKDLVGLNKALDHFEVRLSFLEAQNNSIAFTSDTQVDNDRFNATAYNINQTDRCTYQPGYNLLTLPLVTTSSMSKIKFTNNDGTYNIPAALEMLAVPIPESADNSSAIIDTAQPFNAVLSKPGKVWDRNVITTAPVPVYGAQMYLYVKIPNDLSATADTNGISLTPFPVKTVDILSIEYTTEYNITLGNNTNIVWSVFNSDQAYFAADGAAGNVIPGAWTGDEALDVGPKMFYFEPKPITAIRMKLRQRDYFTEAGKTIYSYGLSKLDIRYDKFLSTGKTIIRFDAPSGDTISAVNSLTPLAWNLSEYQVGNCFSYRVIWETSYNSPTYTLSPVSSSKRVWVEVTLNQTENGGTPALSGLILKYS